MDYLDLPIGDKVPDIVTAVVEIPLDGVNKYEYDKTLHVFRLDRNLHSPVHYPGDYGFIPQTIAEDGDPLDILILGDAPTFPGCVFTARPVGLFEMLDQGVPDEKILAYATGNPRFSSIQNYKDVPEHILLEVEHFFRSTKTWNISGLRCWAGRIEKQRTRSSGLVINAMLKTKPASLVRKRFRRDRFLFRATRAHE